MMCNPKILRILGSSNNSVCLQIGDLFLDIAIADWKQVYNLGIDLQSLAALSGVRKEYSAAAKDWIKSKGEENADV